MSITDAINQYKDILGSTVKLVAVSKTKPESAITEAYQLDNETLVKTNPEMT